MGVGLSRSAARALTLAAAIATLTTPVAACGGDPAPSAPSPAGAGQETRRPADPDRPAPDRSSPAASVDIPDPPACIDDGAACVQAGGRILYVERVDPDGDGDAHFVTTSTDSITAPGITVFDVRPELRPDPLPGPGDAISASGPVLSGSYGQSQIEADAVAVAYAR